MRAGSTKDESLKESKKNEKMMPIDEEVQGYDDDNDDDEGTMAENGIEQEILKSEKSRLESYEKTIREKFSPAPLEWPDERH